MFGKVNSRVLGSFQKDLIRYRDETGKASNEVIASQALNFSIRATKLFHDEAPTKDEITREAQNRDYRVIVRGRILKKLGITKSRRGKSRSKAGNKSAQAVQEELKVRRSSVKWIGASLPKWKKGLNKNIPEASKKFGIAKARRTKKIVGLSEGTFSSKRDRVLISGFARAIKDVNINKGNIVDKALRETQKDFVNFLDQRMGREYGKRIKKSYK